jgi:hypothetical protein
VGEHVVRVLGRASQLIQFFGEPYGLAGKLDKLVWSCAADCEAEFLEIPAFKAIRFLALPGMFRESKRVATRSRRPKCLASRGTFRRT